MTEIEGYRHLMRPPETFETARLCLRPVRRSDAANVFDYAGSDVVTRYMPFATHVEIDASVAFVNRCEDCWRTGSAFPWSVIERASDQFLGVIEMRLAPPKADFGYIFREAAWGHGFASEAASAVVAWAISQPSIFRVWATCHPDNSASAAVLRRAGLSHEATLESWEARPQLGEVAGASHCYALVRPSGV